MLNFYIFKNFKVMVVRGVSTFLNRKNYLVKFICSIFDFDIIF